MTILIEWDKLETALALLKPLPAKALASGDDEEGDASGSIGGGTIIIEKTLFAELFGLQRAAEKQFGPVGEFDPMAYVAEAKMALEQGQAKGMAEKAAKSNLKKHPILGNLSKFDGDDRKMSMNPEVNDKAQERNEQRNELRMALKNAPGSAPKLKPAGM